jgi:hypothetical protein
MPGAGCTGPSDACAGRCSEAMPVDHRTTITATPPSPDPSVDDGASPPGRGWRLVVAVIVLLAAIVAAVAVRSVDPDGGSGGAGEDREVRPIGGSGYVDVAEIERRVRLGRQGRAPWAEALDELLAFAEREVGRAPTPPPVVRARRDVSGPMLEDAVRAYGLGLAHLATGERRYARAAADTVVSWAETAQELRNTCPGRGDCHTSLLVSRSAAGYVFAAEAVRDAGVLDEADERALRRWLRDVLLPATSRRDNNWGDAGTFARVAIAGHLGDRVALLAALDDWRAGIDRMAGDGSIPEEVRRGRDGMMYTQEALTYKVAVATMAAHHGVELWSYRGAGGATLERSVGHLARRWTDPASWPFHDDPVVPRPGPMWELAYAALGEEAYEPVLRSGRPFGERGNSAIRWSTLTHGVPLGGDRDGRGAGRDG